MIQPLSASSFAQQDAVVTVSAAAVAAAAAATLLTGFPLASPAWLQLCFPPPEQPPVSDAEGEKPAIHFGLLLVQLTNFVEELSFLVFLALFWRTEDGLRGN